MTRDLGLGIGGSDRVYLDLTDLDRAFVTSRLGAILDIYRKFAGSDPLDEPMQIFPAAHYAMGGLWVDFERDPASGGVQPDSPRNHATNIPGLMPAGSAITPITVPTGWGPTPCFRPPIPGGWQGRRWRATSRG